MEIAIAENEELKGKIRDMERRINKNESKRGSELKKSI